MDCKNKFTSRGGGGGFLLPSKHDSIYFLYVGSQYDILMISTVIFLYMKSRNKNNYIFILHLLKRQVLAFIRLLYSHYTYTVMRAFYDRMMTVERP